MSSKFTVRPRITQPPPVCKKGVEPPTAVPAKPPTAYANWYFNGPFFPTGEFVNFSTTVSLALQPDGIRWLGSTEFGEWIAVVLAVKAPSPSELRVFMELQKETGESVVGLKFLGDIEPTFGYTTRLLSYSIIGGAKGQVQAYW